MNKKELFKHLYLTGDFTLLENYPEDKMDNILKEYELYEKGMNKIIREKETYEDIIKYKRLNECKCKSLHKPIERIRCNKELLEHIVYKLKKIKPTQSNRKDKQLITEAIQYYNKNIEKYNNTMNIIKG